MGQRIRRGRGDGGIYRRADGRWCGQYSLGVGPDGKRQRVTVYGATRKEVVEKLAALRQDALKGLPVKPEKLTVREHLEDWLGQKKRQTKPGTWLRHESHIQTHLVPALGHLRLRDLDHRHVNALYTQLQEKGLAARTIHDISGILREALDDAVTKGLIARNPAKLVPKPGYPKKEARFLSPEELRWLLLALPGERLEAGFIVALHTGMRPGEWLGLPWDAVDLAKGTATVRQALHEENGKVYLGPPKTKAAFRTITLPPVAVEALRAHRKRQLVERMAAGPAWQDSGLVFTGPTGGLLWRSNVNDRNLARVIKKARQLAGEAYEKQGMSRTEAQERAEKLFVGVTLHTFRHTHAAALIAQGVDILTISRRLGHENVKITLDLYGHLMPGQDEKAARAFETFVAALGR